MPLDTQGSVDVNTDSRTASFDRKRPHEAANPENISNAGSATSTPGKKHKRAKQSGHEIRDFVPSGGIFTSAALPLDKSPAGSEHSAIADPIKHSKLNSEHDHSLGEVHCENEEGEDPVNGVWDSVAVGDGRRLLVGNLPDHATKEDVERLFDGYPIENITLHRGEIKSSDLKANEVDGDATSKSGSNTNVINVEGSSTSADEGKRLYIGNLPYAATEENLREFFNGYSVESVDIPINPRSKYPVGYAFVDMATSDEADLAVSTLSKREILERKVSIQKARKSSTSKSNVTTEFTTVTTPEDNMTREEPRSSSDRIEDRVKAAIAPRMNWNRVDNIKIRTTLGGGSVEAKSTNTAQALNAQNNEQSQDKAIQIAFQRLQGFRERLAGMDPHDGPVSAYKTAQEELHNAEVDYNYCLHFPTDEEFYPPSQRLQDCHGKLVSDPTYRSSRFWNFIEESMKEGTLQKVNHVQNSVMNASDIGHATFVEFTDAKSSHGVEHANDLSPKASPTYEASKQIQRLEIKQTQQKMRTLLVTFSFMRPGGSSEDIMKSEAQEAEVDADYCQYFPNNEEYLPLALAKSGLLESAEIDGTRDPRKARAAQIWNLAKRYARDRKLHNLKEALLDGPLLDVPALVQPLSTPENSLKNSQGEIKSNQKGNKATSNALANESDDSSVPLNTDDPEPRAFIGECGRATKALDELNDELKLSPVPINASHGQSSDSGSEDGVLLDRQSETLPVELSQGEVEIEYSQDERLSESESSSESDQDDASSDSEADDAMIDFSNSMPIEITGKNATTDAHTFDPSRDAHLLSELDSRSLKDQMKYFHVTTAADLVDLHAPVRCLVCTGFGHMAAICDALTCTVCGVFNQHVTRMCPRTAKCSKCREVGHEKEDCPYKLKHIVQQEILCDLCQRRGHSEDNCELIWRTSGRPWEYVLADPVVRLSCYECGQAGHLGNDCLTRRPGKSLGTSSWSSNAGLAYIKSVNGLSIKGRAQEQQAMVMDDSDDALANFHRPKATAPPTRKGQIRITTAPRQRVNDQGYDPGRGLSNDSIRYDRGTETQSRNLQYNRPGDRRPHGGAQLSAKYDDGPGYGDYRSYDRRSLSPEHYDRNTYSRSDRYPPPAPRSPYREKRPGGGRGANLYRPMPSAAQNAWSRHRM